MSGLQIWAGVEGTLNRVGEDYLSQCDKSGHSHRHEDLDLFASLNTERLRYPCLWELAAPVSPGVYDWSWLDERLRKMRALGIQPIAGLLHHGSGPRYTSLIDPLFPEKFANYARDFAARFPWIEDYTPINEPLTTARFSCLYGFWYPHERSGRQFVRAIYFQIRATILAMKAIREINPRARLVQTEDLGRAQSTAPLEYQRDFENSRRWLTFDMLCGKIEPAMRTYLKENGLSDEEESWLTENALPPDIIGINHYLLSSRFLDHRLELYHPSLHGGNGQDRYVDVGAVDTPHAPEVSPASVYLEAWDRYRLPLAATEVHVRGHRESQMRWLEKIWRSAQEVNARGGDFRAVTAWSLLGTFDWDSLCTRSNMFYEPGVFDMRSGSPKPTALANLVRQLAHSGDVRHPIFDNSKPILITGGNESVGRAVARVFEERKMSFHLIDGKEAQLSCPILLQNLISSIDPWAILNTAGECDAMPQACAARKLPFVTVNLDVSEEQHHGLLNSGLDSLLDDEEYKSIGAAR